MSLENIIGWGIILATMYIFAVYTDVTAKMTGGLRTATVSVKRVSSRQRVLDLGGFIGGIVVGPKIIAWVLAFFGGALGAISLGGIGFSDTQIFVAGMVAIAAGVLVSRWR